MKNYITQKLIENSDLNLQDIEQDALQTYFNSYGLIVPSDYALSRVFFSTKKTTYLYENKDEEAESEEQLNNGIRKCTEILGSTLENENDIIVLSYDPYEPFYTVDKANDSLEYCDRVVVLQSEPLVLTIDEDDLFHVRAAQLPFSASALEHISDISLRYCSGLSGNSVMGVTTKIVCTIYSGGVTIFDPKSINTELISE